MSLILEALFFISQIFTFIALIVLSPFEKIYTFLSFSIGGASLTQTDNTEKHKSKVRMVQEQVKEWNKFGRAKGHRMVTSRPGWKRVSVNRTEKDKGLFQVDLGDLNEFVRMDNRKQLITVEPGFLIGQLTTILSSAGWKWTLPVIPEYDPLTIGGLLAGGGGANSCHKYGFFNETVVSYEFLLPSGEVVACSETENSDLFYAIPGSHGTLGFIMSATFLLIKAAPYVKIEYKMVKELKSIPEIIKEQASLYEVIEGFTFSREETLLAFGNYVEIAEITPNFINQWWKPFYYLHVREMAGRTEYIPLREYYHRHTRGVFWVWSAVFPISKFKWFHRLFGWTIPTSLGFFRLLLPSFVEETFKKKNAIVEDHVVPIDNFQELFDFCDDQLHIYPVWICPMKIKFKGTMLPFTPDLLVDVGCYGFPNSPKYQADITIAKLERKLLELRGFRNFYGDVHLSRTDFRKMFNLDLYDKVRENYGCVDAFPEVYEKVCRNRRKIKANNKSD